MSNELDVEEWASDKAKPPLPNSRGYRVRLWDGDGFDEKRRLDDATPTGAQVLTAFERHPVNEYVLLLLDAGGLHEIAPDETIDIGSRRAERFFAFHTDRTWNAAYNDRRFPWGQPTISEPMVRLIFHIPSTQQLILARKEEEDFPLADCDSVNLDDPGLERIYSQKHAWKLLVQGVLLTFETPKVLVRDALVKAGLDPDSGWTAALKFVGSPREVVDINDTIDLTRKGIEKLWLRPSHINNGDNQPRERRAFPLRALDEKFLIERGEAWETLIDDTKRWFIIRAYTLPEGYKQKHVDIAVLVPPTYPAATLDMFYCAPHLQLSSGRQIPQTQARQSIEGISYQRWSRHRHGDTLWNPATDSLITHIAIIDDAIAREVGD